jgi:hypothetical protein
MKKTVVAFACASLILLAADPWKDKKASEWSSKDATRVLTNSPWAKSVSAEMDFTRMRAGAGRGMGRGGGGMGGPGGGMGGPDGGMEAPKILVRWESAAPVREASAKTEAPHDSKLTELAKEYYVISTSGTPMMGGNRRGQQAQGRPQPDFSRMQERIIEATSLRIKDQDSIAPAKVEVLQTDAGMMTVFLFPRTRAISPTDKEVIFETSMGPMVIKTKFAVKEMTYEGQLAL